MMWTYNQSFPVRLSYMFDIVTAQLKRNKQEGFYNKTQQKIEMGDPMVLTISVEFDFFKSAIFLALVFTWSFACKVSLWPMKIFTGP